MNDVIAIVTPGGYFHYRKRYFAGDFANLLGVAIVLTSSLLWYFNYLSLAIALIGILLIVLVLNGVLIIISKNKKIDPNQIKVLEQEFKVVVSEYLKGDLETAFKECEKIAQRFECNNEVKIFYQYLCKKLNRKSKLANENITDLIEPAKSLGYLIQITK